MPAPDFNIKTGDTASSVYATLEDANTTPVDIQNATVLFKMAAITGGTLVTAGTAEIAQVGAGTVDGSVGAVVFNWGAAGVPSTPGSYIAEWEVTFAGGSIQTFPNTGYMNIEVAGDL